MADEEVVRTMLEVHEVATEGEPSDRLALSWELRRKSRLKTSTVSGEEIGLFLPRGTVLFEGDLLRTADDRIIAIEARA